VGKRAEDEGVELAANTSRERARKILLDAFWTAEGWRKNPAVPPDEFELAKSAGVMFDPSSITHDEAVDGAIKAASRIVAQEVALAFVASLSSRRLEYRSALGSFAFARRMPPHEALCTRSVSPFCDICGDYSKAEIVDWNVLNFERIKWGGVRHDYPRYIRFDLELFGALEEMRPIQEDWDLLRIILRLARSQSAEARPSDLERAIGKVMPSNKSERRQMMQILAYAGVFHPRNQSSLFDVFTPSGMRVMPADNSDWSYPMAWWRGTDGVRADAIRFWFPEIADEFSSSREIQ
jgi:hypothetical protein